MPEALRAHAQDGALVRRRRRRSFLAVCRVLAPETFHEATVDELAREAGLAAGSIHDYRQSKEEL